MKNVTRKEAVELLRAELVKQVDDRRSLCQVASERGIFCRGFSQWSLSELKERFPWIARLEPAADREQFEKRANQWMLHRQFCKTGRLPCDVPQGAKRCKPCHGWDEFYESELSAFCSEVCGQEVRVVPESVLRHGAGRAVST